MFLAVTIVLAFLAVALTAISALAGDDGGVPSLGDTLQQLGVDTGLSLIGEGAGTAGAAAEAANSLLNVLDAYHSVLLAYGYRVDLELQYEPMDVPQAIHLREDPKQDRSQKHIRIDAHVTFTEDLEDKIPAARLRGFFGMDFPKKGPVAGKVVRWEFSPELMKYVEIPTKYFDEFHPTWIKRTDSRGTATIYLHPILDQPLGGIRRMAEGVVEADVPTTASKGFTTNPFSLAVGAVSDELMKPAHGMTTVRVERHIPTQWRAKVTIERTIECRWDKSGNPPDKAGESSTTRESGSTTWKETLIIDDALLDESGTGAAKYDYGVTGKAKGTRVVKTLGGCGSSQRMFTSTTDYAVSGEGKEEDGDTFIAIRVDPTLPEPRFTG